MFLHSGVCVRLRDSGWQTHSLCVAGCSASAKDKQWRVERVICLLGLNSSPWSPAGLSSLFFLCMLSYFEGEQHFSQCLHASVFADAVDSVLGIYSVYVLLEDTADSYMPKKAQSIFRWAISANGAEVIAETEPHPACILGCLDYLTQNCIHNNRILDCTRQTLSISSISAFLFHVGLLIDCLFPTVACLDVFVTFWREGSLDKVCWKNSLFIEIVRADAANQQRRRYLMNVELDKKASSWTALSYTLH